MRAYFSLLASFLLLSGLNYQFVKSSTMEKGVLTLQQIYKKSSQLAPVKDEVNKEVLINAVSLRDISNAFKAVMGDSIQISQLIPTMFKVNVSNPMYVFSLPQEKGHNFLTMSRDKFSDPIFPNLTSSYIHLMRSKRKLSDYLNANHKIQIDTNDPLEERFSSNFVEDNESILALNIQTERNFIDFVNHVNKKENKEALDEWKLLGLDGWQGYLSRNSEEIYLDSKRNNNKILEWDLPGKMREKILAENLIEAMKTNKFMHIVENLTQQSEYLVTSPHDLHSDSDVYIGRVNDPFGHSTKWNEKHSLSNDVMQDRKKRGVIELFSMIKCSTGCDPIIFKGYGCYCGFLGDGYPVDGIDRCCRMHDKCYEYSNCIPYLEYFVPYIWKCYRGKPLCAIDHGEWGGPHSCAARLCQCDLNLSRCLRRFLCPHRRSICRTSKTRILQNLLLNF